MSSRKTRRRIGVHVGAHVGAHVGILSAHIGVLCYSYGVGAAGAFASAGATPSTSGTGATAGATTIGTTQTSDPLGPVAVDSTDVTLDESIGPPMEITLGQAIDSTAGGGGRTTTTAPADNNRVVPATIGIRVQRPTGGQGSDLERRGGGSKKQKLNPQISMLLSSKPPRIR